MTSSPFRRVFEMLLIKNEEQLKEILSKRGITEYVILEEKGTYTILAKNGKSKVLKFLKPYTKEEALEDFKYLLPSRLYVNLKKVVSNPLQTKALKAVKYFLKKKMRFLILAGSVGSGKTMAVLMGAYLYRYHKIRFPLFVSVPSLLLEKEKVLKDYPGSDCLILDDFNRVNDYTKELALELFLDAYNKNRYAFITTNLSGEELRKYFDQHVRSRVEEQGMVVEIKDKDYRVEKV